MSRTLTDEQLEEVVGLLEGTSRSLDGALQAALDDPSVSLTDLDEASLGEIDERVFQCEVCGWWCEASECAADESELGMVCAECAAENEA